MTLVPAHRIATCLLLSTCACFTACGGDGGDSSGDGDAATGGDGNAAGGSANASGGTSGLPADPLAYPPVICDPVPPACPPNVLGEDFVLTQETAETLRSLTTIQGTLDIEWVEDMSVFDCLEDVSTLILAEDGDYSGAFPRLKVLRNLEGHDVGKLDCAFRSVTTLGIVDLGGGEGELNLSSVTDMQHFRLKGTDLSRVILPNNIEWGRWQMFFYNNLGLREILGFENVTVSDGTISSSYSLWIEGNPLLPECHATRIQQMYLDANYDADSLEVGSNGPPCL